MNFIVSNQNTFNSDKKIIKSVRLLYLDIPIPNDYKFSTIKLRIGNISNNINYNGALLSNCSFLIPVMSSVGFRTLYSPPVEMTIFLQKNNFQFMTVSFFDMENNLISFTENYTLQLFVV